MISMRFTLRYRPKTKCAEEGMNKIIVIGRPGRDPEMRYALVAEFTG